MPGGVGILVPEPLTTADAALEAAKKASADPQLLVEQRLKHVTRGVEEIRAAQLAEGLDRTLIGFYNQREDVNVNVNGGNESSDDEGSGGDVSTSDRRRRGRRRHCRSR